ncbi:Sugar kinase of the NBD/HSP70 family, may contain an N-terminal HTH domain [Amycolatopsis arida]|uniref:Sugar kinase of the NBD/HSP70 family, may contain an N-terminal HTH domain n=1 Tax=Amycolatopsis arida TaxID=587909 RepID=A0A1I5YWB8_9PSEU|nr:ROK family protein [Amycolatopsis arida]TDX89930.1 putative NBD/HSP70 family sugar kinase [Amycolatopsis arida]SFQ48420.1 Sugar kinase of the NBD/HSP70 family, may contain an N-terminal HTH domain [Amycolatopsis arida]
MPTRAEPPGTAGAQHSAGHLLWLVRTGRARTRAELQRTTGLSRSTVGQRLDALLAGGFLRPAGVDASTGGRPPTRLDFNHDHGLVACADLGATQARLAVFDLAGAPLARSHARLRISEGPERVLDWVDGELRALLDRCGRPAARLRGIGIGVPGPVEASAGVVRQPPIMPGWDGFPVAARLRDRWGVPVLVDNDANAMAFGEYVGSHPDCPSLVLVKVATGIGAGLVLNGQVYRGIDGGAGDLGHIRVDGAAGRTAARCMCGATGCLAALASGAALAQRLTERGVPAASSREFVSRVRAGVPEAVALARAAGQRVGEVLSTVVCLVNPQVLVLAGDLAETQFVTGVREVLYRRALPRATRNLEVTTSELGEDAGVRGLRAMVVDAVYAPDSVDRELDRLAGRA